MAGLGARLGASLINNSAGLLFRGAAGRAPQAASQAVRRGAATAESSASRASARAQTPAEGAARQATSTARPATVPNAVAEVTLQQAASSGTPSLLSRAAAQFRQMQRPAGGPALTRTTDSILAFRSALGNVNPMHLAHRNFSTRRASSPEVQVPYHVGPREANIRVGKKKADVSYDTSKVVGFGETGQVHNALVTIDGKTQEAVVKTFIPSARPAFRRNELAVLDRVQRFQRTVKIKGVIRDKAGNIEGMVMEKGIASLRDILDGTAKLKDGSLFKDMKPSHQEKVIMTAIRHIVDGLEQMHTNGIIHQDLWPKNVMLFEDGFKMIDFGKSMAVSHLDSEKENAAVTMMSVNDYKAFGRETRRRLEESGIEISDKLSNVLSVLENVQYEEGKSLREMNREVLQVIEREPYVHCSVLMEHFGDHNEIPETTAEEAYEKRLQFTKDHMEKHGHNTEGLQLKYAPPVITEAE